MADRRRLRLTRDQRLDLERHRDHDPRPYVRERSAALVKIAEGMSPHAVAQGGLLRMRDPATVYGWLNTYEADGLDGVIERQHGGARRGHF
jgi:transposase